jgi:hypothetical protein
MIKELYHLQINGEWCAAYALDKNEAKEKILEYISNC